MLGVPPWGVPLWRGEEGVQHWDPCCSATAPSLSNKATRGGAGIPAPGAASLGLRLGMLPAYKVKIKAWSQTIVCRGTPEPWCEPRGCVNQGRRLRGTPHLPGNAGGITGLAIPATERDGKSQAAGPSPAQTPTPTTATINAKGFAGRKGMAAGQHTQA